jgi:hypothetical protein
MNRILHSLIAVAVLSCHTAGASAQIARTPAAPDYTATQKVLDAHRANPRPPARVIENVYARGLAPTADNIAVARRWLTASADSDSRVAALRLLGSLYRPDDPARLNATLARDVKTYAYGADRKVALTAVQTYARMGHQPDAVALLEHARAQKIIGRDDYAQELAIALALLPPSGQAEHAARLARSGSAFGAQVLALTFSSEADVARLTPEAARHLLGYMHGQEPSMPKATGEFGLNDGGRWAEWLHLTALLEQATGLSSYDEAVWTRLNDERTDPRKLLGFLTSTEGTAFTRKVGSHSAFARPVQRVTEFSRQFPGHPTLAPTARGMLERMDTLRQ